MKQYFLALYKKEFGLMPKITKAKDGIYIYLFSGGSSRAEEAYTKKATYSTQRYFIGVKDWEYAIQHNDKDFYNKDYILNTDDYLYNIHKDNITLDMSPYRRHIAEKLIGIPQEIESFGRNFAQFKGKPKEAIEHLIKVKNGQVRGALYHNEVGDIDLIWGNKIIGLSKVYYKRLSQWKNEDTVKRFLLRIPDILKEAILDKKESTEQRKVFKNSTSTIVVETTYYNKNKIWVMSAYRDSANKGMFDNILPLKSIHGERHIIEPSHTTTENQYGHILPTNAIISKTTQNVKQDALFSYEELSKFDKPTPTEAQKNAGNYRKPKIKLQGMTISIENLAGSTRSGIDENGDKWEVVMQDHYGYINGTKAIDGDHLDIFINSSLLKLELELYPIYVIEQIDPKTGVFDEFKLIAGAVGEEHAKEIYLRNYSKGWRGFGAVGLLTNYTKEILTDSIINDGAETMNIIEQIKSETSITKKAKMIMELVLIGQVSFSGH